jgi:CRP-like cAMP-binding protein
MARLAYHDLYFARPVDEEALSAITSEERFQEIRDALVQARTWREQIGICLSEFRASWPLVPFAKIGDVFGVTRGTISNQMERFMEQGGEKGKIGRPPLLSRVQREEVFEEIQKGYQKGKPLTMGQILDHIAREHEVLIDRTTLLHIMSEDGRIKPCIANPMEDKRLAVTVEQIAEYFEVLERSVQGKPAHFVFNMDEMGHQDWADRKKKTVYVPVDHDADEVDVPVARCGKRITLVGCIALDGSYLKPMVIIPRKTVDYDLAPTGLTDEKVEIVHQPKGYINTQLFDDWFEDIFLTELAQRRSKHRYDGEAVLLLDGCSCHSSAKFRRLCEENNVIAIFFPPHSSNQVQPLDLSLFGTTKKAILRTNRMDPLNIQTEHIVKVVNSFMSAATPCGVVKTFRRAGLVLVVDGERLVCQVSPVHATALLKKVRDELHYEFNFGPPMPEEEEEEDDIDADVFFERCQGMALPDVFLGDFSDDDDGAGSRRPRRPRRRNGA